MKVHMFAFCFRFPLCWVGGRNNTDWSSPSSINDCWSKSSQLL